MGLSYVQRWSDTEETVSSKVEQTKQANDFLNQRLLKVERRQTDRAVLIGYQDERDESSW